MKLLREAAIAAETVADKLSQRFNLMIEDADIRNQLMLHVASGEPIPEYLKAAAKLACTAWEKFYELDRMANI